MFAHELKKFIQFASENSEYQHTKEQILHFNMGETPTLKQAAVLVLLQKNKNSIDVLLTQRAIHLPTHQGEICFPGGKVDPKDLNVIQAALRELQEEVGIQSDHLEVWAMLPKLPTLSGFDIAPVVAWQDQPSHLILNPGEVAQAFTVPLTWILNLQNYQTRVFNRNQVELRTMQLPYLEYDIWGATATVLHCLAQTLEHYPCKILFEKSLQNYECLLR